MDILKMLPTVNSLLAFIAGCMSMMYLGMAIDKIGPSLLNYSVGSAAFFVLMAIFFKSMPSNYDSNS